MVNKDLVAQSSAVLGQTPLRILVTGGTGFVGYQVAETLGAAGHHVTVTGRNSYAAPRNEAFIKFRRADIRNKDKITALCEGQDYVIHAAANTSPWATAERLNAVNVLGTQNVIDGCREHRVKRLVHVSSTAIHFAFQDAFEINEETPRPVRFACGYAESKALAEQRVRDACEQGLDAFIVRARAVFGSRDACLLPRLFRAYDQGRLRQIGDGLNLSDLTFVDNLVYGLILALRRGESGGACTIVGREPVKLWTLLQRVLTATGRDQPLRAISFKKAMVFARMLENTHRLLNKSGEPALTRYSVGLLGKSQTFSRTAAIEQLNYSPVVDHAVGVEKTIEALSARANMDAKVNVRLTIKTTGYTTARFDLVEPNAEREPVNFHATFAIIEHPKFGLTLFDTGYSPRFYNATEKWPYRLLSKATPVETDDSCSAVAAIERLGFERSAVQRIIVSHFHSDHVCGLSDFPNADVIAMRSAWESVAEVRGLRAVRKAIAPGLIPIGLEDRLCLFNHLLDPGIGPFERSQDLFGDGSVRLIALPGHAAGQIGALLQTGAGERKLLVSDAVWTRATVTADRELSRVFRMIAHDSAAARETKNQLVQFAEQFPDIEIIPTHCPEVVRQYGLDESPVGEAR